MTMNDYAQALSGYGTLKKNWGWIVALGVLLAIAGGFALIEVITTIQRRRRGRPPRKSGLSYPLAIPRFGSI